MYTPTEGRRPPKNHYYTTEELKEFDGSMLGPIFVAIKGTVFDVSSQEDIYGVGKSYNILAGRDASMGIGMSSLKSEHAVADYSSLNEADLKVLDGWYDLFVKKYDIAGTVYNPQGTVHTQTPVPTHYDNTSRFGP